MTLPRNAKLLPFARQLRKEMTKEERHLWYDFLRDCPYKFTRQKIVHQYILDFYCDSKKLAVELDGSQHYEEKGQSDDAVRTEFLNRLGICVLRFSNAEVKENFRGVCEAILLAVGEDL